MQINYQVGSTTEIFFPRQYWCVCTRGGVWVLLLWDVEMELRSSSLPEEVVLFSTEPSYQPANIFKWLYGSEYQQ